MSTNAGAIESSSDAFVSSEPPNNFDIAVTSGVVDAVGAESLGSKAETLTMEPSSDGVIVQDSVDDTRVSGGETGDVIDKSEKHLDESSPDAVLSSVPPPAASSGGLGMESCDHDGGGDVAVQDLVGDVRVSRDGTGIVIESSELVQDSAGDSRVSGDEKRITMDKDEKRLDVSSSDAIVSSETGADLLELKSGTLVTETTNHHGGGDIVAQDSIHDTKVSIDETGIVTENNELVLDQSNSDAVVSSLALNNRDTDVVNGVKNGADSLASESETLTMKPSGDQNGGGDITAQVAVDDSRVSGDEKEIAMEKIEKASDKNEVNNEEKEGEYKVTDIVWAKVKDYPWWPGQIFDPSASNDKAKKYSNKKGFFVGYYGDQTFAWNKASKIKPFRNNFGKLEKQSNSKAFFHAVNCALDEVSRRVDFGLTCSCISKEVRDKIKTQVFVNSGIREEASKIDGGDRYSTVSTFKPVKVVQSVQELAREHFDGFNRLEVLSVRTQLLAYFRWKGYYQLQAKNILDALDNKLEDEWELPITEEKKVVEDEKPDSVGKKVYSRKRKPDASDGDVSIPPMKETSLTNLTPKSNSSVRRSKKNTNREATSDDNVFKEGNGNKKPASVGKKVASKKTNSDVSDSDDFVSRKKEKSLTNITPKGNSSAKRSKKSISKDATPDNNVFDRNGNEEPISVGKKVSSKKRKPDVSDSDDSVPRKKERSLTNMTPKGNSSAKRSKKGINKKATVEDTVSKEEDGNGSDSDGSVPHKKEKSLMNMTPKGNSSVKRSKNSISKKVTVEDTVSKEENGNGTDDKKSSIASPKKLFRVGDSICRIAKQISQSPTILKKESSKKDEES